MPFGIRPAPEVFRSKMNELVEGSRGLEVIANDFVVLGTVNRRILQLKTMTGIFFRFSRNVMSAEFI